MENRVVALAVLENLIHWPLTHRSGYVAPNSVSDEGGEDDNYSYNAVSAGDADDLLREPRQRKLDRYRAVLLLPHLCHKLGRRWVESEVVPYLLRNLEEDDSQLSLVSGLALLGVTLPRRSPLASSAAASPASDGAATSASKTTGAATPTPSPTSAAASTPTAGGSASASATATVGNTNAYLSLDDVQPVCVLLASSSTEETRAFAAQVILPHLYLGTALERDITLESWDLKFVPLSVLHADMISSSSGGGGSGEDDGCPAAVAVAAKAEEGDDAAATLRFVSAVRKQLVRQRQQADARKEPLQWSTKSSTTNAAENDQSLSGYPTSNSASLPTIDVKYIAAAGGSVRSLPVKPTEAEVRKRCHALAAEDEDMQFLFSGSYDTLTGPWGFSGCRLASLTQGAKVLYANPGTRSNKRSGGGSDSSSGKQEAAAMSSGGGFRSFRCHERRASGSQALRGAPSPSQRPLSEADLELCGASYAVDEGSDDSAGNDVAAPCDDFFSVNVRARALVGDLTRWMEALTPAEASSSPTEPLASPATSLQAPMTETAPSSPSSALPTSFLPSRQNLSLYDYFSHEARRVALRCRWQALLKLLQSFLGSSYPGPVAVAVELISGLLHALQYVMTEVEAYLRRGPTDSGKSSAGTDGTAAWGNESSEHSSVCNDADAMQWGIGVPAAPLLTTAQLQSFMYRTTRRHVAYCAAAAVTVREVDVPSSLPSSPKVSGAAAASAWRAPTESLAQLLRAALSAAQQSLTDLLLRHQIFVKVNASLGAEPSTRDAGSGGACVLLQMGPGPREPRVAMFSAWDVSFTPSSAYAGSCIMPDDASFLVNSPADAGHGCSSVATATAEGAALAVAPDRTPWLPGTLNAFSMFRVHRVIQRAVLRALPLSVDFLRRANRASPPSAGAAMAASAPTTAVFTVRSVCPILLQFLAPPSTLATLLRVLHAAEQLPGETPHSSAASKRQHVDPLLLGIAPTLAAAFPILWAAMAAHGSIMGSAEASSAAVQGEETPSSLDFAMLGEALDAVQRLVAEAAVQLPAAILSPSSSLTEGAPSSASAPSTQAATDVRAVHALCAQLFTLVAVCVRWVPRYTSWKARWLIARKLPLLISTFCFLLAKVSDLKTAENTSEQGTAGRPLPQVAVMWLQSTLQLLTSVWSCADAFGVAPLNDLTDDEEMEVRCVAVCCAASIFRRVAEAALRVSAAASSQGAATGNESPSPFAGPATTSLLLPPLTEPLTQLLDATAQCVLVGANDVNPRVRCRAAEALAVLSRSLSTLVAADDRCTSLSSNATSNGKGSEELVWTRYLRSNTDALLRLMSDEKPTVQLALVSQLTDPLLMCMRQPSKRGKGETKDGDTDDGGQPRGSNQVYHEALLHCLSQLAQHELWRLREQYAVLLAHLCGRLLQTAVIQPQKIEGRLSAVAATAAARGDAEAKQLTAAPTDENRCASTQVDASPYGPTHPLYQLARTELLTLLVAVLFDKVKAVRDAALDAVERMCLQLAAATQQSNSLLQQDAATPSGRARCAGRRAAGTGATFESITSSAAAPQGASNSNTYNVNTFVDNVLWPRISAYAKAWETYLSRNALLHIALRLRVDKTSVFIPLLDQLARDPVLNVRLVVAKIVLEVLLRSSTPDVHAVESALCGDGEEAAGAADSKGAAAVSLKPELPSGAVAYRILMNKPALPLLGGSGCDRVHGLDAALPPLQFTEEERKGVILQILRQLLKDSSSDVRDEAAKALKVCF
ncbi:hypothetical protein ABL78_3320 [Leptomonas seymouri]|uniref:Uncharacterized protein n=1 Tax=Leptomonas seymouri TaxID=5684 RepID=A0A0N1IL33_LEPSE|nr:hypothetical protein ABL78_3320 [Leptomonas seymouri]|eukprot:KPI87611.1 hypothetical protein ABL78_3320 [Leptomonas seymouri]